METPCPCDPALMTWDHEDIRFDEHQCVIPGTCTGCGEPREYVYTESGIRAPDGEYLHEF